MEKIDELTHVEYTEFEKLNEVISNLNELQEKVKKLEKKVFG